MNNNISNPLRIWTKHLSSGTWIAELQPSGVYDAPTEEEVIKNLLLDIQKEVDKKLKSYTK